MRAIVIAVRQCFKREIVAFIHESRKGS